MSNNMMRLGAITTAILAAAALRLVPHPPNFAPIGAMALFSGANFRRAWQAFGIPLAALFAGDALIGFYPHMEIVYASFAAIVLLGRTSLRSRSMLRVGTAAVASSMLFYLVTNLGVWLYYGGYPSTPAGLAACYAAAIPYFWNTLAGDLVYSALLFGGFALLEHGVPQLRSPPGAQLA